MRTHDYIDALISLLEEGRDFEDVIKNLKVVLEKKGHQKLYRSILEGLSRRLGTIHAQQATVHVAREKDIKTLKEQLNAHLQALETDSFDTEIDPTLIGGYVIEHNNKIIDNSYKSRLVALYRSLIN